MASEINAQNPSLNDADAQTPSELAPAHARKRNAHTKLPDLSPGAVIKHYELIRELGSGAMGLVFLARDVRLGRLVAIKFLLVETGVAVERFVIEARATASCRHENIVVIYDVGEVAGFPYLVLEYIQGRTVREAMQEPTPDRAQMAIELMLPVARALACAHAMGIIHRDLKPENILISDTGQVKVVDFGIAKQIVDTEPRSIGNSSMKNASRRLTDDDALVGTSDYMSPEQWLGEKLDARADIWAIGVILFELTTGVHPMELLIAEDLGDVSMLEVPMPSARQEISSHSKLAEIIDKCLMKRIDERLGSAQELVEALERLQRQEQNQAALSEDESPFAGLAAFQEADAARFFGRDDDIAAVVAQLRHRAFVAIAGPSGAGKSSFVRAGVMPALRRAHCDWEVFVVRPGRDALASLAEILVSTGSTPATEETDQALVEETLRTQPGYFGTQLRARCKKHGQERRILLFVDQFEEIYTQGTAASERAAFGACLEGAADDASSPVRVIVTIRSDFLDLVAEERRYLAAMTRGLVFLPSMRAEGLRQALEKPLELAGYQFEETQLVTEMLDGLSGMKTPLPILQFMASKLWEARDRQRRLLTRDAYISLGGVAGALSTHADAVLAGMTAKEQRLARGIFSRLVTPEKTRAVLHWDEILSISGDTSSIEQVVQHLADARLLLIEASREHQPRTVELAHESLIAGWTTLRQWLTANENDAKFLGDLRTAAGQWENNGRTEGFLWRDRAATYAREWFEQYRENAIDDRHLELGAREVDYLEAVVGLANRAARKRKQLLGGVMAGLCGVVFVVSLLGLQAKSEARRADSKADEAAQKADEAKQNALEARNATRMAAVSAHAADSTLVLALLRELEPTTTLPPKWNELAQLTLRQDIARVALTHDEPLQWASFSADGQHIVTASWDGKARVWDADGRGDPVVLEGHTDQVLAAAFSPNGKRIVTASSDKTVRVWNADGSGKSIVLEAHGGPVNAAVFSPDGKRVVTGSSDKMVRIWKTDGSGKPVVFAGHEDAVSSVAFSPDGQRIVTASHDGTARVWTADRHGEPIVLRGHRDHVLSAAFSPDGQRIVTGSSDNTARVWNADGSGEPIVFTGHMFGVHTTAFSPDGTRIITASWDHTARVWNADGEGNPVVFDGHQDKLSSAFFSPDGTHIVTASLDKSVRVWEVDRHDKPQRLVGHQSNILAAAFNPDGTHVVTASLDKTARVWRVNGPESPLILRGHEDTVWSAAFSPDGKHVVTASQDKTIRKWDATTGAEELVWRGHSDGIKAAAFSPDGRRIVSASLDRTVRVWNADGQDEPLVLRGHDDAVNSASFSLDGQRIISVSQDKTARLWNADGSGEPRILRGHVAGVYSGAFSPDRRHVVTGGWDKTARLWEIDNGDAPLVFHHNAGIAIGALGGIGAFNGDGSRFITISDDNTLHIWNSNGSSEPIMVRLTEIYPELAAFSPDGSRIVTASHEQKDPATGRTRYWATIWPTFDSLIGPDDARLWRATTYCPPVALRRALLGVSEKLAQEQFATCRAHVAAASERTSERHDQD